MQLSLLLLPSPIGQCEHWFFNSLLVLHRVSLLVLFSFCTTNAFIISRKARFVDANRGRPWNVVSDNNINEVDDMGELCFDLDTDLTESSYTQVLSADVTNPLATNLRAAYDSLFVDPREPNGERFVFDPWVVQCGDGLKQDKQQEEADAETFSFTPTPGETDAANRQIQYSLKRAQLSQLLSNDELYDDLIDVLSQLGQSIGCNALTPPWISIYTHGDMQNFHTDAPHGPMAFVLSLTMNEHYRSKFTGGETMLLQPQILDYWRNYDDSVGLETPSIVRFIPPTFGRCIAFDPRVPHGVTKVQSHSNDPRTCRVVIHGWFAEPEVQFLGEDFENDPEMKEQVLESLNESLDPIMQVLGETEEIGRVVGFLSIRLNFDPDDDGLLSDISCVCDTLVADPEDFRGIVGQDMEGRDVYEDPVSDVKLTIEENLMESGLELPQGISGSIVVPFVFS